MTKRLPLLLLVFFAACVQTSPTRIDENESVIKAREVERAPIPPWQTWNPFSGGVEYQRAADLASLGKIKEAAQIYKSLWKNSKTQVARERALTRWAGEVLKLGESKKVLEESSAFLKSEKMRIDDASPELQSVVSFAYIHQGDIDQSLAWLSLTHRRTGGQGRIASLVLEETKRQIRSVPQSEFEAFNSRWSPDGFIGPLFAQERFRRMEGGRAQPAQVANYFRAESYMPGQGFSEEALPEVASIQTDGMKVGVLLPLSGRYSSHAKRVKQGIELAQVDWPGVSIVVGDTGGDAAQASAEFKRLVTQEGVTMVLGPLLVSTTRAVHQQSKELGVPFLTFTKRQGIPELGETVFRLGATFKDQVRELVSYSRNGLQIDTFGIVYPETPAGEEFYELFREEVRRSGGKLLRPVEYASGNPDSMRAAAREVVAQNAQAVFIPDSLERMLPLLETLNKPDGSSPVLLGPAYWDDPVAIRGLGQFVEGAIYVSPFYRLSSDPRISDFVSKYRLKYDTGPDLLAAQAYDAAILVFGELKRSQVTATELISRLKQTGSHRGVTGDLKIKPSGEISRSLSVLRLEKGEVVEVAVNSFLRR